MQLGCGAGWSSVTKWTLRCPFAHHPLVTTLQLDVIILSQMKKYSRDNFMDRLDEFRRSSKHGLKDKECDL